MARIKRNRNFLHRLTIEYRILYYLLKNWLTKTAIENNTPLYGKFKFLYAELKQMVKSGFSDDQRTRITFDTTNKNALAGTNGFDRDSIFRSY